MTTKAEGVETQDLITVQPVPVNENKITALIEAAKQLPQLEAALDQFRTFVLKRALPGDWVSFKEMGSDEEVLELTGAATDRIASALGVSFVDMIDRKESGTDDKGQWYTWWYECTTLWQGRRIERVTGRAGSRDPFFGIEGGELKALSDVKEGDVRTAARRNCMKEGVKLMLGLRRIPKSAAGAMGLDVGKVKAVNFGSRKGAEAAPSGTPVTLVKYETKECRYKDQTKDKKTFPKWTFTDDKGAKYETIKEELAQKAITFVDAKKPVLLAYEKTQYGNDLKGIKEAPAAAAAAPAPAADAKPAGEAKQ